MACRSVTICIIYNYKQVISKMSLIETALVMSLVELMQRWLKQVWCVYHWLASACSLTTGTTCTKKPSP